MSGDNGNETLALIDRLRAQPAAAALAAALVEPQRHDRRRNRAQQQPQESELSVISERRYLLTDLVTEASARS